MPFQPINFANIAPQGNPFMANLMDSLMKGYQAGQLPRQTQLDQQKQQLANTFQGMMNQQQPQKFGSEMQNQAAQRGFTQANTNRINTMTPLDAQGTSLSNTFASQMNPLKVRGEEMGVDPQKKLDYLRTLISGVNGIGNSSDPKNLPTLPLTNSQQSQLVSNLSGLSPQGPALTNNDIQRLQALTPNNAGAPSQNQGAPQNILGMDPNTLKNLMGRQMLGLPEQTPDEKMKQQIDLVKALTNIRITGLGTGGKEEMLFQSLIGRDNPTLSPTQIYEASNVLRRGGNTLSDGTQVNPLSPASQASFDRLTKYGTTAPLITSNLQGAQAESEIDTLRKYAQAGLKPYGDTTLGYSPKQLVDTFKTDDASQDRLGKLIGAKQLQFEIAQNQIKLANGKPGVTTTQELMNLGMQNIKTAYPMLSQKAREVAQNYFVEALKAGYEARKNINLGAASSYNQTGSSGISGANKASLRYNPKTGTLESTNATS